MNLTINQESARATHAMHRNPKYPDWLPNSITVDLSGYPETSAIWRRQIRRSYRLLRQSGASPWAARFAIWSALLIASTFPTTFHAGVYRARPRRGGWATT